MREEFAHYATGDVDLFQDFLERTDVLHQDKVSMLEAIAQHGWDECLEVWVGRESPLLNNKEGRQAWITMAGEGHTDCWMQLAPLYLALSNQTQTPGGWSAALVVCKDDAAYVKAWDIYALASTLKQLPPPQEGEVDMRYMTLVNLRIQLMHGLDHETATQEMADAFVTQSLQNTVKTPDNVFEGLSWG